MNNVTFRHRATLVTALTAFPSRDSLKMLFLVLFGLMAFGRLAAQQPELVKDINTMFSNTGSRPQNFIQVGNTLFFTASTLLAGEELWKSDGTVAGTVLVKDIYTGGIGSQIKNLINVDGTLFFAASDQVHGRELWKSDGTASGTVLVKDIYPRFDNSLDFSNAYLTNVNGTLFFVANDGQTGQELWKSDGTAAGTMMVKDIKLDAYSSSFPWSLTNVGGTLFFTANDGTSGQELWKSDGTATGTVLVKDIRAGSGNSLESYSNNFLTNVNDTLFFAANDGSSGKELWKSDGTASGTVLVKDINPGSNGSLYSYDAYLTNVNGTLFFKANDGTSGEELWKSDGTESGTMLVKEINPSGWSQPNSLTNIGGTLFFSADDGVNGTELWKSDGTESGTMLVKDIHPGSGWALQSASNNHLTNVNGTLFFIAQDGTSGQELWKSDGTASGTMLVKDIQPGGNSSLYFTDAYLTNVNGTLFFAANDGLSGTELWKSDGTAAGTMLFKDIWAGSNSSSPYYLTNADGMVFFVADDGTSGQELWKSDGTAAGTVQLKDIRAGSEGSISNSCNNCNNLTNVNGTLFFTAYEEINGTELWKSDGTAAGTVLVKDIRVGSDGSNPRYPTRVGNTLFFEADNGTTGYELWKSDGTAAGTMLVKDIRVGSEGSSLFSLTSVGNMLFFTANDGVNGEELWKSDGTAAGTMLVKDINPVSGSSSSPVYLRSVGNTLFFTATDGTTGYELWKSDGTASGTMLVKDINPGNGSSNYCCTNDNTADVNGTLFFVADDGTNGYELWKSNGTASGTVLVKDIFVGNASSQIKDLTSVGNTLFFTADDGTTGEELWKSDGTTAGTMLVKDIYPGSNRSNPVGLTNVDGTLFFEANDGTNGYELWKSDGTAAGTVRVYSGDSGIIGFSNYYGLVALSGVLFSNARSDAYGSELYRLCLSVPDAPTGTLAITNSTCTNCSVSGGSIALGTLSGTGGTLQYSTDGGTTWSNSLPSYNQIGPAQTIIASVLAANGCRSNTTAVGTTVPGTCTTPAAPTGLLAITNSTCSACALSGGSIALGTLSGTGGTLQYSTDNGTTWSSSLPSYNQTGPAQTIIASVLSANGCRSNSTAMGTTVPGTCTTPAAPTGLLAITNSTCSACALSGGSIALGALSGTGGTLQYSTDNGTTWSSSLPSYNQAGPAQTIIASVLAANGCRSNTTAVGTTVPGTCITPTVMITNNNGLNLDCNNPQTTLSATAATSYNWTRNGNPFGSTQQVSVTQAGTYAVTITAANGCTASSSVGVNFMPDTTLPGIDCPGAQTLILDGSCSAVLPNYTGMAVTSDNCGVQSVTQSPAAASTVSGAGNTMVTLTVTDVNGLTNTCAFTVTKVDNTLPGITCVNQTIQFNGESSMALNASSLVTASDNCGIQGASLSPASVSISQFNQTVPVTVTVTDNSGNAAACTAQVTVLGLPAGWSQDADGIGCAGGNDVDYSGGVFTVNSAGCYSGPPFTADAAGFAQQELCGNGSITVQVTGLSGGGWAGIVMRESDAPGARKVQLMTNRATFNRREVRSTLGGQATFQQFVSQNRYWLRILRQGNQFVGYTSLAGNPNWSQAFVVTLNGMPNCLSLGLVVTNNTTTGTTSATFANVSIMTNANLQEIETNDLGAEVAGLHLDVFPNPTSGEVTVDFTPWAGKPALLEVYDLQGRRVYRMEVDEAVGITPVDMSQLPGGVYLFRVGEVQQRVVLQR